MEKHEFQRLLNLFPIIRDPHFSYADTESSRRSIAQPPQNEDTSFEADKESVNQKIDERDAFWVKLQMAAEKKVGAVEAENFCEGFRKTYNKLVNEGLSLDDARNLLSSDVHSFSM